MFPAILTLLILVMRRFITLPHCDLPLDTDPRRKQADQRRATRQSDRHQEHSFQAIHVTQRDVCQYFGREQTFETRARGYHRRRVDAGDFGPQAGDQHVAEDGLAGGDEDCGAEELEDCVRCVSVPIFLKAGPLVYGDEKSGVLTVEDCGRCGDIIVRR
jgi:hypothetical protein